MAKEVILTPIAIANYEAIIEYLDKNWSIKVVNDFIDRFEDIAETLATNPEIFPFVSQSKQIQKCVVTKHNVLYFKENINNIVVIAVFDTRQNPDKLTQLF